MYLQFATLALTSPQPVKESDMAFVSISEIKGIASEDRRCVGPTLTINKRGVGYITRAVYGETKPTTIEVEIDFEEKAIRLITGDCYAKKLVGRVKHSFNVPAAARRKLLPDGEDKLTIALTKSNDGWWYGSFGRED